MNKKSLLMMMVTICLIAVVGVGATLAYLSDSTETLKNTFTLGKVDITLTEQGQEEGEGLTFTDIVPGMAMDKDPTVTVVANSVDSYVFMSVKGINDMAEKFTIQYIDKDDNLVEGINPSWKKISNPDGIDGIYVYVDANNEPVKVAKEETDNELEALFDKVTYKAENTEDEADAENFKNTYEILVKAAAVQATGEAGYTYESAYDAVEESLGF